MENIKYIPGDLVKIKNSTNPFIKDDTITKVVEVDSHGFIKVIILNSGSNLDYQIYTRNVVPIHLTPEILEKNGWNNDDDFKAYVKRVGITFILLSKLSNGDWNVCLYESRLITCKYVHQLQHILFGLGLDNNLNI